MKIHPLILSIFLLFFLVGCQPAAEAPPTRTAQRTSTVAPATNTPTPAQSATPAATPTNAPPQMRLKGTLGKGFFSGIFRSPDGKRVVALLNSEEVRWYDGQTLEEQGRLPFEDQMALRQVVFSSDPARIAVLGTSAIRVIDVEKKQVAATADLGAHSGIYRVSFSADARFLVFRSIFSASGPVETCCADTMHLFDIEKGQDAVDLENNETLKRQTEPVLTPNGQYLIAGLENHVRIWDVQTGKLVQTLDGHQGKIASVALNSDGSLLASGDSNGLVRIWNTQTWQKERSFLVKGAVLELTFDQAGKQLRVERKDGVPQVAELETGKITDAPALPAQPDPLAEKLYQQGYAQSFWGDGEMALSADGKLLATGGSSSSVLLWNLDELKIDRALVSGGNSQLSNLLFSPDGRFLAATDAADRLYLWDVQSGAALNAQPDLLEAGAWSQLPTNDYYPSLAFSPDGNLLVANSDRQIAIWNIADKKRQAAFPAMRSEGSAAEKTWFSANGKELFCLIITRSSNTAAIQRWDWQKQQLLELMPELGGIAIYNIQWPWFVRGDGTNDEGYWFELSNHETGQVLRLPVRGYQPDPTTFSPDGKFLIGYEYQHLYFWRTSDGALAQTAPLPTIYFHPLAGAITPDSQTLILVSGGVAEIWDISEIIDYASQPNLTPVALPTP